MCQRHALTLLEVLAATVLLTLLAATCLPMLQRATRLLDQPEVPFDYSELARLADSILADPEIFGLSGLPSEGEAAIGWPESPDRPMVVIRVLSAQDTSSDHVWLRFSCDQASVHRWIPVRDQSKDTTP